MLLPGDLPSDRVLPALFYPGSQAPEAGRTGDIIYKEDSVDVTIVVLHHGLPETLLSRRVPQLELEIRRGTHKEKVKWTCRLFSTYTQMRKEEMNEHESMQRKRNHVLKYPRKKHAQRHAMSHHREGTKKRNKHIHLVVRKSNLSAGLQDSLNKII